MEPGIIDGSRSLVAVGRSVGHPIPVRTTVLMRGASVSRYYTAQCYQYITNFRFHSVGLVLVVFGSDPISFCL